MYVTFSSAGKGIKEGECEGKYTMLVNGRNKLIERVSKKDLHVMTNVTTNKHGYKIPKA